MRLFSPMVPSSVSVSLGAWAGPDAGSPARGRAAPGPASMTITLEPAEPEQPLAEAELERLETAEAEAEGQSSAWDEEAKSKSSREEAEGHTSEWGEEVKSKSSQDIFAASFLTPLLVDLNQQQQALAKDAFEDWASTAKARMEEDFQKMTRLVLDLASCSEVVTAASNPVMPMPIIGEPPWTSNVSQTPTRSVIHDGSEHSEDFVLLPLWTEAQKESRRLSMSFIGSQRGMSLSREETRPVMQADPSCLDPIVMYPASPRKMIWDTVGAALIIYDLFSITLQAFNPPETNAAAVLNWVSLVFWTLNVPMSLLTGFTEDGITVLDPRKILRRYLRTWFLVDVIVVGLDWSFTLWAVLTHDASNAGSSVRLLRVLRLFRMVRLARLLKLRSILQSFYDMIDSEYLGVITDIGIMVMLLFLICHVIACMWFWIGEYEDGATWIKEFDFVGQHWTYQYLSSFHWAITQFTPASMHVQPQNITERSFAIVIVLFALVGFSYVVGSITGSLTQLRMMRENVSTQFWELRRYLRKHKVPIALSARIQKYLEHVMEIERRNMPATKVRILSHLSEQLKSELEFEISMPQLSVHPLFEQMNEISRLSMHRLANTAIEHRHLARTDLAFVDSEEATHMYFVVRGRLDYFRLDSKGQSHPERVDKGEDWIAEPVLWMKRWLHLGALQAVTECEMVLVRPRKFREVVRINPIAFLLACTYAKNFIAWIQSQDRDELSDIWQGELVGERVRKLMEVGPDGSWLSRSLKSSGRKCGLVGRSRSQHSISSHDLDLGTGSSPTEHCRA